MTTNPKANKALKVREGGCSPVSAPGTGLGEAPSGPRSPGPPWCVRKGACQQGREGAAGWRKYLREAGRVGAVASGDVGEEGWVPAGQDVLVSPAPRCGCMASDPAEPLGLAGVGSPCVCVCVCVCVACRPPGPCWVPLGQGGLGDTPWTGGVHRAGQPSAQQPAPGTGGPQRAAQLGQPRRVGVAGSQQGIASGSLRMACAPCRVCPTPGEAAVPVPCPVEGSLGGRGAWSLALLTARVLAPGANPALWPRRSRRRRARTPRRSATMSWCPCRCGS